MPAKSKKQRQAAGVAYSKKCKGKKEMPKGGASKSMAKGMSCKELRKYAKSKK